MSNLCPHSPHNEDPWTSHGGDHRCRPRFNGKSDPARVSPRENVLTRRQDARELPPHGERKAAGRRRFGALCSRIGANTHREATPLGVLVKSRPSRLAPRPSSGGADAGDGGGGGHRYPADKRGFPSKWYKKYIYLKNKDFFFFLKRRVPEGVTGGRSVSLWTS